jgi:chromosome partitioning protein
MLVVDLDPQANSTTGLGIWDAAATVADALDQERAGAVDAVVQDAGWPVAEGQATVSVVPSSPRLAQSEHQLAMDVIGAQDRLAMAMQGVVDRFDDVLIDCPPSLGLLTVNALFAAERVLIVAEPAAWSADGVEQILRNIERIAERRGGQPSIAGIVVNRLGRTRDANYWDGQLRELHPNLVLGPAIRLRAAVAEAAAQSTPVHALTRDGAPEASSEFDALAAALGLIEAPVDEVPTQGPLGAATPAGVGAPAMATDVTASADPGVDGSAVDGSAADGGAADREVAEDGVVDAAPVDVTAHGVATVDVTDEARPPTVDPGDPDPDMARVSGESGSTSPVPHVASITGER